MASSKALLGAVLLVVGGAVIMSFAGSFTFTANVVAAVCTLTLAAGALLIGSSEEGRTV